MCSYRSIDHQAKTIANRLSRYGRSIVTIAFAFRHFRRR